MTDKKKGPKYAVVDLEATGTSATDQIIQVGIVIVEDGKISRTYETDVNPHQPLTQHIINLTGITDQQLAQAPDFSQVAREIYELINDCIFVAHNVKFDANLLAEQLFMEGFELHNDRVDTVELAQVFFPTLERYRLSDLASYLDLELEHAHTAIADAYATAQLLLKIKETISHLPRLTIERVLDFADQLLYESRLVIDEVYATMPAALPQGYQEVHGIVLQEEIAPLSPRHLSGDFATNIALLDLDERKEQQVFATDIKDHLDDRRPHFVEAKAGIGKTLGYLLALLQDQEQRRIIVSVPTKVLQDQIMAKEARRLEEVFHISSHSLKGPQNYIKLDAFYDCLNVQDKNRLVNRYKMQILVWLTQTKTGDLDEIKQRQRYEGFFDQIKHDGNLSRHSIFWDSDFWNRSYRRSQEARIVITNHAYLLTRIEDDKAFVEGQILVVDEAQKLFLALEQFSRRQVNLSQVMKELQEKLAQAPDRLSSRILESLQFELNQAILAFHKKHKTELTLEQRQKLATDLAELPDQTFPELTALFASVYGETWLTSERFQDHRVTYLNSARMDFMNFSDLLPESTKTFYISATLAISDKISLAQLLGLEDYSFTKLPQRLDHKQAVWVDSSMPDITTLNKDAYARAIVKKLDQLSQLGRPMIVLFTAKALMFEVSEQLDKIGLSHLCQEKNGLAANIKRRFDKGESAIILGTGSFWEGVDFAHQDQLIEVITRLPFDNPLDPFTKKLNQQLRLNGYHPFYDYALPVATLRLKQAMGRTMRRPSQLSAVIVLDNRLMTKDYGASIWQALYDSYQLSAQNFEEILAEMAQFFGNI